jgi:hypothetical protein
MFLKKTTSSILYVALLLLLAAGSAFAQTQITTGVIQGVVMDESGAVMPGTTVTVRNLDTNFEQTQETDANGRFVFLQLRPGPYMVRVSQQGFSTLVVERTELTVGQTIPLSLNMKVSPVAEEITVSATPTVDLVQTASSSTLNELSVESTPVLGRKFEDLFTLTPGVSITQGPDGDEINFVGQRGIFTNISLDGGDYINGFFGEQLGGQRPVVDITMEAVKEFQVTATGGTAEFGRTASGVVNVITKSGTNEVHGNLFYFQRHEKLTHKDSQGNVLKGFQREQFGGTIGGPFVKDKAFGFFAFEQIYSKLERPNLSIPIGTPCSQSSFAITNPADEALINGSADCQRLALLEFFQSDRGSNEGQPVKKDDRGTSILAKFDANITPGNQFNASYNVTRSKNINATFDVPTYGNSANGIEGTPSWIQSFRANLFSTVSPTMFNEGTFAYTRETRPRSTVESNVPADTGVGFAPSFRFGNPFFLQPTVDELFWRTQIRDNFSIIAGSHTVKLGGEWIHSLNSQVFRGFFTSRYLFDSVTGFLHYTADPALGPGYGPLTINCDDGSFGDFFLGCTTGNPTGGGPLLFYLADGIPLSSAPAGTPSPGASSIKNEEFAFFVQDKWQIRPNFTLNYGLRWEAQYMPETVDPSSTAFGMFLGEPFMPSDGTIPDQTDMWQPRVGFAWDVLNNQKSALRASWGIYYARQNMLTQVGSVTTNGLQQRTNYVDSTFIGFVNAPVWPNTEPGSEVPCVGNEPFPCFTGIRVFSRAYKNPKVSTANVNWEQEFAPNWSYYADFTWSKGVHMTRFINFNRAEFGAPFSPFLGDVFVSGSPGKSLYRGLTIGMRKRFSDRYQLEWNYVYSKDMDDDSNERDPFTDRSFDPTNLQLDYGLSDRDIKHKFNFAGYFELPYSFILNARIQGRTAQPISPTVRTGADRNTLRKDNEFFSFDWRLSRPFKWGDERFAIEPVFEMFNTFNNKNLVNPLSTPALFNFDGFLRQGVGDPLQVQLAVKFTF